MVFLLEIGFRIVDSDYKYYERTSGCDFEGKALVKMDTNWVQRDEDLGWVCRQKPDLNFYRSDFFDVKYHINSAGFRTPEFLPSSEKRILILGDSFLFGLFLEEDSTVASRLNRLLGDDYRVFNMSAPGWGVDQMYHAYLKYVDEINPDQVILFFIDDDISRVMEAFYWGAADKKSFRLVDGELTLRAAEDGKLGKLESFFCFNSQIVNRLYRIDIMKRAEPLAKVLIDKIIQGEQQRNRNLMAFRFPRKEQIGSDMLKKYDLTSFFESRNCFYRDLEKSVRSLPENQYSGFYIPGDDHPSAAGTLYISGQIGNFLD